MPYTEAQWRDELYHFGILGQKWGVRRYQNSDGTYTAEGKARYSSLYDRISDKGVKKYNKRHGYDEESIKKYNRTVEKYSDDFKKLKAGDQLREFSKLSDESQDARDHSDRQAKIDAVISTTSTKIREKSGSFNEGYFVKGSAFHKAIDHVLGRKTQDSTVDIIGNQFMPKLSSDDWHALAKNKSTLLNAALRDFGIKDPKTVDEKTKKKFSFWVFDVD